MDIQDLASFFMDKRVLKVMDPRISRKKTRDLWIVFGEILKKNTPQKYGPTKSPSGEIWNIVKKYLGEIFQFLFKH